MGGLPSVYQIYNQYHLSEIGELQRAFRDYAPFKTAMEVAIMPTDPEDATHIL